MVINVHAGHNADGRVACGAIGLVKESTEARKIKNEVIRQLIALGHTVYDCTVDDARNESDNLRKIVSKCNAHKADLDVSIHLNKCVNDLKGNGYTTGTEVWVHNNSTKAIPYADRITKEIAKLGYRNRGVKVNSRFYVLRKTKAPAMIVECFFLDDKDDVNLYNSNTMADAIVRGITGKNAKRPEKTVNSNMIYRVQVGAFSSRENAEKLQSNLKKEGFDSIIVAEKRK